MRTALTLIKEISSGKKNEPINEIIINEKKTDNHKFLHATHPDPELCENPVTHRYAGIGFMNDGGVDEIHIFECAEGDTRR